MQVTSIAACSKGSILQYFRPSSSYRLSLRPLFCLFLSGHLRQVLLTIKQASLPIHNLLEVLQIQKFWENFIFENSIKRHICNIKNSRLGHDIPISVNDRVILPFHEGFNFKKLRICEASGK